MLTLRAFDILRIMANAEDSGAYEDAEIIVDGIQCWIGLERISRMTVNNLLQHVAISLSVEGGLEHYTINGVGRNLLKDPIGVANRVRTCLEQGIPCDDMGYPIVSN